MIYPLGEQVCFADDDNVVTRAFMEIAVHSWEKDSLVGYVSSDVL